MNLLDFLKENQSTDPEMQLWAVLENGKLSIDSETKLRDICEKSMWGNSDFTYINTLDVISQFIAQKLESETPSKCTAIVNFVDFWNASRPPSLSSPDYYPDHGRSIFF